MYTGQTLIFFLVFLFLKSIKIYTQIWNHFQKNTFFISITQIRVFSSVSTHLYNEHIFIRREKFSAQGISNFDLLSPIDCKHCLPQITCSWAFTSPLLHYAVQFFFGVTCLTLVTFLDLNMALLVSLFCMFLPVTACLGGIHRSGKLISNISLD